MRGLMEDENGEARKIGAQYGKIVWKVDAADFDLLPNTLISLLPDIRFIDRYGSMSTFLSHPITFLPFAPGKNLPLELMYWIGSSFIPPQIRDYPRLLSLSQLLQHLDSMTLFLLTCSQISWKR